MDKPVGWLYLGNIALCRKCVNKLQIRENGLTRVYHENIHPYNQKCGHCREDIMPYNKGFPELWDGMIVTLP